MVRIFLILILDILILILEILILMLNILILMINILILMINILIFVPSRPPYGWVTAVYGCFISISLLSYQVSMSLLRNEGVCENLAMCKCAWQSAGWSVK
jgi:hypothetical protein